MKFYKVVKNDICWCKTWCKTRNKRTASCILSQRYLENLKYNVKQAYIFNLILIGIPSNVILTVINRGGKGFLLNSQNLLSMTKVIGWGSLRGWLLPLEFKICLKKLIPSPEMWKLHPIPGYNFSWYTEQQALVLFHVINY